MTGSRSKVVHSQIVRISFNLFKLNLDLGAVTRKIEGIKTSHF